MGVSSDVMRLAVPARHEALGVLRTMAGNAARLSGFGYNRVEEARLAVNEAASLLVANGRSNTVRCLLTADDSGLEVELEAEPGPTVWPPELWTDTLEYVVLSAITDSLELVADTPPKVRLFLGPSPTG